MGLWEEGIWECAFLSAAAAFCFQCCHSRSYNVSLSQGSEDSEDDDDDVEALVAVADTQGELEADDIFNSDDDSESCPICLNAFRDQAVGTPENCAHYFCLDCIMEWSKVRWLLFRLLPPLKMAPFCL